MSLIPNIGLAKFRLAPTKKANENPITCILSSNSPSFYTVTNERMKELLKAEKENNEHKFFMWSIQDRATEIMFAIQENRLTNDWLISTAEEIYKLSQLEDI